MRCPFCNADDTKVSDSRLSADGSEVRRRRCCMQCDSRFTTYERAELIMPRVVKRDGSREAFDENKLRRGINKALEKRPVSTPQIDDAIAHIVDKARACGDKEIQAHQIGEWLMEALRQLDDVAYVRFASVYRRFQDVEAFRSEIEQMLEGTSKKG